MALSRTPVRSPPGCPTNNNNNNNLSNEKYSHERVPHMTGISLVCGRSVVSFSLLMSLTLVSGLRVVAVGRRIYAGHPPLCLMTQGDAVG